jgi:hypothetical protein
VKENSTGLLDRLRVRKGWKRSVLSGLLNGDIRSSEWNLEKQIVMFFAFDHLLMIWFFISPLVFLLAIDPISI